MITAARACEMYQKKQNDLEILREKWRIEELKQQEEHKRTQEALGIKLVMETVSETERRITNLCNCFLCVCYETKIKVPLVVDQQLRNQQVEALINYFKPLGYKISEPEDKAICSTGCWIIYIGW